MDTVTITEPQTMKNAMCANKNKDRDNVHLTVVLILEGTFRKQKGETNIWGCGGSEDKQNIIEYRFLKGS